MRRLTSLFIFMLVFSLLTACTDAGKYIKDTYPLVSADGNGSSLSKVYAVEGKTIPEVAAELHDKEKPIEQSSISDDQMFLLYSDKMINIQKDPKNANDTLVQIDSIPYAKQNYDSSFLQTYLAISLLQSVFDDDWLDTRKTTSYKGYSKAPTYSSNSKNSSAGSSADKDNKKPTTSEKTGTFSSSSKVATKNNKSTSNSNIGLSGSGSNSTNRKNDGSTPNRVSTSTKSSKSKPSTSSKTGSFKRR